MPGDAGGTQVAADVGEEAFHGGRVDGYGRGDGASTGASMTARRRVCGVLSALSISSLVRLSLPRRADRERYPARVKRAVNAIDVY